MRPGHAVALSFLCLLGTLLAGLWRKGLDDATQGDSIWLLGILCGILVVGAGLFMILSVMLYEGRGDASDSRD